MRAPSWGAPAPDLYAAALEMCAWAEDRGCLACVLCEHHCAEDGYLPSPLVLASAIAARTQRLMMSLVIILPFYDPVRLAEDMAVLDLVSKGRATYVFGIGYRAEEFDLEELTTCFLERVPLGRLGVSDDIAPAIRYLAGPESSWVTGQSFAIDGGNQVRGAPRGPMFTV
jgi:hypothetical protein